MTKRTKVLSVGIQATDNLGDVAITQMIFTLFAADGYVVEKMDFNFRCAADAVLLPCLRNTKARNRRKSVRSGGDLFWRIPRRIGRLFSYFVYLPAVFLILACKSRGSSKVFMGGGNLLMGIEYGFPLQALFYVLFSRLLGKRVIFLCVGAGPFTAPGVRTILKIALRFTERIIYRDSLSKELVERNLGISSTKTQVLLDPVLLWPMGKQGESARYDVLFNYLPLFSPAIFPDGRSRDAETFKSCMIVLASELARLGKRLGILVTDSRVDLSISLEIMEAVEAITGIQLPVEVPATPHEMAMLAGSAEIVFSTRMHGAIIAMSQCVPALCICWQPKIRGLYADLGFPECLIELDVSGSFSVADAHAAITRLTKDRDFYVGRIRACRQSLEQTYKKLWATF